MKLPKISWKYGRPENTEDQALVLFWTNPWDGREETVAYFLWPGHPGEETENVEKMYEAIANRATLDLEAAVKQARAEAYRDAAKVVHHGFSFASIWGILMKKAQEAERG